MPSPSPAKSILNPFCCGFGKICLLECARRSDVNKNSSVVDVGEVLYHGFQSFLELMKEGIGFDVTYQFFKSSAKSMKLNLADLGKSKHETKKQVVEYFCKKSWLDLTSAQRKRHSLYGCKECKNKEKNRKMLALFPVKGKANIKKAQEGGLWKPSESELRKITSERIDELNSEFKQNHGCTFEEATKSLSKHINRKERTQMARQFKKTVEKQNQETIVLRLIFFSAKFS